MSFKVATKGRQLAFPSWGRCFWQDPNDGEIILLFASGTDSVKYVSSADSGISWSSPQDAFDVDDFSIHNNFDSEMDRQGNVHCVHRLNSSGCYTFLGKDLINGGWSPSGVISRGFCDASDTLQAKGVQASVSVYDDKLGPAGQDIDTLTVPAARIAAKVSGLHIDTYYVSNPFDSFPIRDHTYSGDSRSGIAPAGRNGGYPIFTNAGVEGRAKVIYSVNATGISSIARKNRWVYQSGHEVAINASVDKTSVASGLEGAVAFGPNMGWVDNRYGSLFTVLTTIGLDVGSGNNNGFELYTAAYEPNLTTSESGTFDFFGRVDSRALWPFGTGNRLVGVDEYPFRVFTSDVYGATPLASGGMPVDLSYTDDKRVLNLYFQHYNWNGQQTITRLKSELEIQQSGVTDTQTGYRFHDLFTKDSGVVNLAPATMLMAGSSGNTIHWQKFKALKHPVAPGSGTAIKEEIVATIGSGILNSFEVDDFSRLYTWNFRDSQYNRGSGIDLPTFTLDYTADSGTYISKVSKTKGIAASDVANLFDGDTTTSGVIQSGDYIEIEFGRPLPFSRIEIAYNETVASGSGFFATHIDVSNSGTIFNRVHTVPEGLRPDSASPYLIKSSREFGEPNVNNVLSEPFMAKHLRLSFSGSGNPKDVREIRFYGGETTVGHVSTSGFSKEIENDFAPSGFHNVASLDLTVLNAYMTGVGFASGSMNAFMPEVFITTETYGYLKGEHESNSIKVNAYMFVSGDFDKIYGHLQNRKNEQFNAFVKAPSGINAGFHAYMLTPTTETIYGYISGPLLASGSLNAYIQAVSGIPSGSVNAYTSGTGEYPNLTVNAYMFSEGANGQIYGYLPRGERIQVYGYIKGATIASGSINAYASGLGYDTGKLNAYAFGISGVASGSMNAYMMAAESPNDVFNAVMIGFNPSDDSSCTMPYSKNKAAATEPTGNFFC